MLNLVVILCSNLYVYNALCRVWKPNQVLGNFTVLVVLSFFSRLYFKLRYREDYALAAEPTRQLGIGDVVYICLVLLLLSLSRYLANAVV